MAKKSPTDPFSSPASTAGGIQLADGADSKLSTAVARGTKLAYPRVPIPEAFVARIESGMQGGIDQALSRFSLIVGPNGSGKTARLRALQFAAAEGVEDAQGRTWAKAGGEIIDLADESAGEVASTLTLTDGRSRSVTIKRTVQGGGRPVVSTGDGAPLRVVFPVASVIEALSGSADKAEAFILSKIEGAITEEAVLDCLSSDEEASTDWKTWRSNGLATAPTRRLLEIVASKKTALKSANERKAQLDSAINGQAVVVDEAVATLALGELRAKLAGLREQQLALRTQAVRAQIFTEQRQRGELARGQVEALGAEVETLGKRIQRGVALLVEATAKVAAEESAQTIPPTVDEARIAAGRHILAVLTRHVERSAKECSVCLAAPTTGWEERRAKVAEQVAHLEAVRTPQVFQKSAERVACEKIEAQLAELRQEWSDKHHRQERLLGQSESVNVQVEAPDPAIFRANGEAVAEAEAEVEQAAMVVGAASAYAAQRAEQKELASTIRKHERLLSAYEAAKSDLVRDAKGAFCGAVQEHLPEELRFGLRLTDTRCRFGLLRPPGWKPGQPVGKFNPLVEMRLHTFLSGAELVRVLLALAAVTTPPDCDVVVLTNPDRGWDGRTLTETMRAFAKSRYPGQIVLTSPVEPVGRVPAPWVVYRLGTSPEGAQTTLPLIPVTPIAGAGAGTVEAGAGTVEAEW